MNRDKVVKLVPRHPDESVEKLLKWADKQDFDSIVVIGYKDGGMCIERSTIIGISEFIGSLERAKADLLRGDGV